MSADFLFQMGIAGIMALAAAVKLNITIRCLDLSIPPNDPDFARLSQDILQSCIRNTELAQEQSAAKGTKTPIAAPIYKSELARDLNKLETGEAAKAVLEGLPSVWRVIASTAKEYMAVLAEIVGKDEDRRRAGELIQGAEIARMHRDQGLAAEAQLAEALASMPSGDQKDAIGALSSQLAILHQRAEVLYAAAYQQSGRTPTKPIISTATHVLLAPNTPIRSPASPTKQLPSPSFSITSSDDSDAGSIENGRDPLDGMHDPPQMPVPPLILDILPSAHEPDSSLPRSPVESHSRVLTLEEGEVFRRGASKVNEGGNQTLLDVLDDEEAGDKLKQEILDIDVHRPRRSGSAGSVEGEVHFDQPVDSPQVYKFI